MADGDLYLLTKPALRPKQLIAPPKGIDEPEEEIAAGDAYATVKGPRHAGGVYFIRRKRISFAMDYGYLPIPWLVSPALLLLEYPGCFTVFLHGKGLDQLVPLVIERRLTWLRECDKAAAAHLPVGIFLIERQQVYPSREAD